MAGLHRLAQALGLATILLYQPLAALHFATDQAHLDNPATSIQVAHAKPPHADPAGRGGGHRHEHSGPPCDFCLQAGAALTPPAAQGPGADPGWPFPPDISNADTVLPGQRRHPGHPVRAPPASV